jgi:hypothetical protein
MNLKDYRTHFIQTLTPLYDAGEAERFFYLTLESRHGLNASIWCCNQIFSCLTMKSRIGMKSSTGS